MRFLTLIVLVALAACSRSEEKQAPAPAHGEAPAKPVTDPAQARALISSGAVVLDVRSPEEFEGGHVEGAVNLPVQDVAGRLGEIEQLVGGDRSKPVVVYCGAGGRASKAKETLEAAGYTKVVNGGGYRDLK